jgi:hypothetical protein
MSKSNKKQEQKKYKVEITDHEDVDAILATGEIDIREELTNLGAWQDFQRESFHDGLNSY